VVVRTWRGWTRAEDADRYVEYVRETGLKAYRETPGNRGAWILRRTVGDRCEFATVSVWDSLDDIRGFAGNEIERAVFYPDDDAFLVERELTVDHWELWD
jgi:antibiotic biosynthesis monooxygenase (ABM) superfamily enzyme